MTHHGRGGIAGAITFVIVALACAARPSIQEMWAASGGVEQVLSVPAGCSVADVQDVIEQRAYSSLTHAYFVPGTLTLRTIGAASAPKDLLAQHTFLIAPVLQRQDASNVSTGASVYPTADGGHIVEVDAAQAIDRKHVTDATIVSTEWGFATDLHLDTPGAAAFHSLSAGHIGEPLAIVFDGTVVSEPIVNEAISGGQIRIDGEIPLLNTVVMALSNPPLPCPVTVVSERRVGPAAP